MTSQASISVPPISKPDSMQASILGVWIKAAQLPQRDFLACAGEILQALEMSRQ